MRAKANTFFHITLFLGAFVAAILGFVSAQYSVNPVHAAENPVRNLQQLGPSFGTSVSAEPRDPRRILIQVVNIGLLFVGTAFLGLMLYAGFMWWSAGGETSKVDTAKQTLGRAIVGFILITMSYAIVTFIFNNSRITQDQQYYGDPGLDTSGSITPGGAVD